MTPEGASTWTTRCCFQRTKQVRSVPRGVPTNRKKVSDKAFDIIDVYKKCHLSICEANYLCSK